ncbi:hypothetical protein [Paracoccus chinensis]|uniref:hypothetical protein n=1 Tax=Paracoccus chinensis TaxID=525640 RepID=UPI0011139E27|nr:hypothetical protein [Paracoccus chinensis]
MLDALVHREGQRMQANGLLVRVMGDGEGGAVIGLRAAELVEDRVKVGIIGHASSLLGGAKGTRLECG